MGSFQYAPVGGLIGYLGSGAGSQSSGVKDWMATDIVLRSIQISRKNAIAKMNTCTVFLRIGSIGGVGTVSEKQ